MINATVRLLARTLTIAIAAAALYRFAYVPWQANRTLHEVEQRTVAAVGVLGTPRKEVIARENIDRLRDIADVSAADANFHMIYAMNARILGNRALAIQMYSDALAKADHRPEIYYNRGMTYLEAGNVDAAVADLTHAARFNRYILDELSGELRDRVAHGAGIE